MHNPLSAAKYERAQNEERPSIHNVPQVMNTITFIGMQKLLRILATFGIRLSLFISKQYIAYSQYEEDEIVKCLGLRH